MYFFRDVYYAIRKGGRLYQLSTFSDCSVIIDKYHH